MKKKDARQKVVTELINNIKILRLNSWVEKFMTKIIGKRHEEIMELRKIKICSIIVITLVYFFPSVL